MTTPVRWESGDGRHCGAGHCLQSGNACEEIRGDWEAFKLRHSNIEVGVLLVKKLTAYR